MKRCPRCHETFGDDKIRFCPFDGAALGGSGQVSSAEPEDLYAQRLLGERYRVLDRLATGEMGPVYSAKDLVSKADVAIRFVPPEKLSDPEIRGRLEKRLERARALDHPNLLRILDHGPLDEGGLFVVMERVEGRSLREAMRELGAFPSELALAVLDQILGGLAELHRGGLVHGNLNPSNVYLLTRGNGPGRYVKVMDVGIMKLVPAVERRETDADSTRVTGDPNYIAPEQVAGISADIRSDLYSAALVAFRMVAARLPFERWSERVDAKAGQVVVALRSVALGRFQLPLERLFTRALETSPERRFQTAKAFQRAASDVASRARRTNRVRSAIFAASVLFVGGYAAYENYWVGPPRSVPLEGIEVGPLFLPEAPADQARWVAALLAEAPPAPEDVMVRFEAARIEMGSDQGDEDELVRSAEVPAFRIDRRPVTRGEFAAFMEATGAAAPADWPEGKLPAGTEAAPVTGVSWYLAQAYAAWRGKSLPTEAMWERASREGALEFGPALEWTADPHESLPAHHAIRFAGAAPWRRDHFYAHGSKDDLGFRCVLASEGGTGQ